MRQIHKVLTQNRVRRGWEGILRLTLSYLLHRNCTEKRKNERWNHFMKETKNFIGETNYFMRETSNSHVISLNKQTISLEKQNYFMKETRNSIE